MSFEALRITSGYIRKVRFHFNRLVRKPTDRDRNPYATHLPVLIGMSRLLKIRRVIEFGCGQYSTLTFLDRAAFPELVSVHSFENNAIWIERVKTLTNSDPRINLIFVNKSISEAVSNVHFQHYDLVFVDDSTTLEQRYATIYQVANRFFPSNVIIIHDFEIEAYREAVRHIPNRFTMTAVNPNVGIAWSKAPISKHQLKELNSIIKQYSQQVQIEDRKAWTSIINETFLK
jgi:predicted O-methyltransferase YrrM